MTKTKVSPQEHASTNMWDVAKHLIDACADKNRLGSFLIVGVLCVFLYGLKDMASADKKELILGIFDRMNSIPWLISTVELFIISFGYTVFRRKKKEITRHVNELVKYKRFFFHYKGAVLRAARDGIIVTEDDIKELDIDTLNYLGSLNGEKLEIRSVKDIQHNSSGFVGTGD